MMILFATAETIIATAVNLSAEDVNDSNHTFFSCLVQVNL